MSSNISSPSRPPADLTILPPSALIIRIHTLEAQLHALNNPHSSSPLPSPPSPPQRARKPRRRAPFNSSKYTTRPIALKLAYLGRRYNGFEHANGTVTPKPTIEEVLWCALRKGRLISPPGTEEEADVGELIWNIGERAKRGPLEISWKGCGWSKCGRTDRGVSAFGQVVGVRVRSNRPKVWEEETGATVNVATRGSEGLVNGNSNAVSADELSGLEEDDLTPNGYSDPEITTWSDTDSFHPINDELPYISILNSILPPDIRILAWCPLPPADFDARFSCKERRYKYFFTNPAFVPTPGDLGLRDSTGRREGWLDIDAMRMAAKRLEGLHDFRNFCKIDASKQMTSCERRITFADVEEAEQRAGPVSFDERGVLGNTNGPLIPEATSRSENGPRVYSFTVHGSSFLWHQVRCMVAILFLVGQGLESVKVVDELLDIASNAAKPMYEMASDIPLVLWDCVFDDGLDWIYAGDARNVPALTSKGDGKFGMGGVVEEVWKEWRANKMDEILSSSLLDLVTRQGDGSAMTRGGVRDTSIAESRSQKVFDGGNSARLVGRYVPVMEKPRLDDVETQNAKYRNGKGARRDARHADSQQDLGEI